MSLFLGSIQGEFEGECGLGAWGGSSLWGKKVESGSGEVTRVMGGRDGGIWEEVGDEGPVPGRGEAPRIGCAYSFAAVDSHEVGEVWSGKGDVGLDGPRRWKRRWDNIMTGVHKVSLPLALVAS